MCCLVLKILLTAYLEDSDHLSGQADTVILYRNVVTVKPFSHSKFLCIQRDIRIPIYFTEKSAEIFIKLLWRP